MKLKIEIIGKKALRTLRSRKSARVKGVFERAIYLQFERDVLLALGSSSEYINASSAVIGDFSNDGGFRQFGVGSGTGVQIEGDSIRFDGSEFVIEFGGASVWSPPMPPKLKDLAGILSAGLNLRVLRDVIYTSGRGEGLVPLLLNVELQGPMQFFLNPQDSAALSERARPHIETLMWALYKNDADAAILNASSILGLGAGLTPSCDDFLCGLIFSLNLGAINILRRKSEANLYRQFASNVYRAARKRTTVYSVDCLNQYRAGDAPKAVSELAYALLTGDPNRVAAIARVVMKMGETSGADTAIGIYYGIRFLLAKLEFAQLEREFNEIA